MGQVRPRSRRYARSLRARLTSLSLLGKFSLLSAIVILLLGVGLTLMLRSQIQERALRQAAQSAELFADIGFGSALSQRDLADGVTPSKADEIDMRLRSHELKGHVRAALAYNREGVVVYASARERTGERPPATPS